MPEEALADVQERAGNVLQFVRIGDVVTIMYEQCSTRWYMFAYVWVPLWSPRIVPLTCLGRFMSFLVLTT